MSLARRGAPGHVAVTPGGARRSGVRDHRTHPAGAPRLPAALGHSMLTPAGAIITPAGAVRSPAGAM